MKPKISTNRIVVLAGLLLLAMPLNIWAQFDFFDFITNADNTITITAYTGDVGGNVVIPASTNGYPVTSIGEKAFYNQPDLTSISIPNSVTNIGNDAFLFCKHLTSIAVGGANANYASVGGVLFNKALTSLIQCPGGLTGSYAIPNGVTSIGDYAFDFCLGLTDVSIPNSVTNIGNDAFLNCDNLTSIGMSGANANYASVGGVLFNKAITMLIQCPGGLAGSYAIPGTVTSIGDYAFGFCSDLTGVTIPDGVTNIGNNVFEYCSSLMSVAIPNSITQIGDSAFYQCSGLTSVTIPNSVTSIGDHAFSGCFSLSSVSIPNSVTNIGDHVFFECWSLTSVTIPDSVTSIGDYAFDSCSSLISVAIPNKVTSIGEGTFLWCTNLTSVTISSSATSIGDFAFYDCYSLTSVTIPDSVTSIGNDAFGYCISLTSVSIPKGVTSLRDSVFEDCYSLTSVSIPNGVTSIGAYAFSESGLTNVIISGNVTSIGGYAFWYCYGLHQAYFQGNAPSADGTIFSPESGTVYYLPGTTGWGATFGGWPTAIWHQPQPQILGSFYGSGAQSDGFHFTISWANNGSVVVEASTDLQNWAPVITNALVAGTNAFIDSTWTNYPQRFYRVRSP